MFEGIGVSAPTELREARLALHWAAQIVAAVGHTLIPKRDDDTHTTLVWEPAHRALASLPISGSSSARAALRLRDFTLLALADDAAVEAFPLEGKTLDDALSWLYERLIELDGDSPVSALTRPPHDLPSHPVGAGAPFDAQSQAALAEWDSWYASANAALSDRRTRHASASAVRCWPHHFDIATLVTLEPKGKDQGNRSMGIGMSPGDGAYDEPYFYVTPWPYPKDPVLSVLPAGGRWHKEGWFGAVLCASTLVAILNPWRRAGLDAFFDSAFIAALATLEPKD